MAEEEKMVTTEEGNGQVPASTASTQGQNAGSGSGSANNNTSGSSGSSSSTEGTQSSQEKTFTQAEVNRMMAREKHQGVNSVYNELGIRSGDKKMLAAVKEFVASQKSEDPDAQSEELAEAEQRAAVAEAKVEAMMTGVQPQYVDDVVTLALGKATAEDRTDLKVIFGELKAKYPSWFDQSTQSDDEKNKANVGQKGTGSTVSSSNKDDDKNGSTSLGARLAAKKHASAGKSTYWGAKK
jgi:hypothetical protein